MSDSVETGQGVSVGDAVLTFLGDTTNLDAAFNRVADQTAATMGKAADSVSQIGDAADDASTKLGVAGESAGAAGEQISEGMKHGRTAVYEAKGEAALLGEMFGIHLPRHVRTFVAELPGVGTALSAAFAATAVLFLIEALVKGIEKIQEWSQHAHKMALGWDAFNTAVASTFNGLEDKLLEAGIKMDELKGDHVDALKKEIELINHVSMQELEGEFTKLAKAADDMFTQLEGHWYLFDSGSKGAKNALIDFESQYKLLLNLGGQANKDKAAGLLAGTLKDAQAVLDKMNEAKKLADEVTPNDEGFTPDALHGPTDNELQSQQILVEILTKLNEAQKENNQLTQDNIDIKKKEEGNRQADQQAKDAGEAITKQIADIKAWEEAQHSAYEAHQIDLAQWLAAETHATDSAAIAHEDYQRRLVAIYKKAGETLKAQEEQAKLDVLVKNDQTEALRKLSDAQDKYREGTRKLAEEYAHLVDAGVAKEFEATAKAADELAKADEELLKAQTKLKEDGVTQYYKDQEAAISKLAALHLITEEQKDDRLKVLEQAQATDAIAILNDQLAKEQAAMDAARAKVIASQLAQVHSTPFFSPAQLAEVKRNLGEAVAAFSNADGAVKEAQAKVDEAHANPLSVTPAELATLKDHLDQAVAAYDKALSDLRAAKASAGKTTDIIFSAAQVAENKKNLEDATAAWTKAEDDIQALHKTASSGQFFSEADKEALLKRIAEAEAAFKAAEAALHAAQAKSSNDNAFIPNAEVLEAEANARKMAAAVTGTQAQLLQMQEKFNKASEADENAHQSKMLGAGAKRYEQALLQARAFGQEILTAQLMENRAALLVAEGEEKQAKARGENTDAIHKEIAALKENENALEKEAAGGKVTEAQKLKNVQAALAEAQAVLTDAKAHGVDTTAMEKSVKNLQQLETATKQATVGDKAMLATMLQSIDGQLRYAQALLVTVKARGGDTTAIEQEIKELQLQLKLVKQGSQDMPQAIGAMAGFKMAWQQLGQMMKNVQTEMSNAYSTAIMGALESGKSVGAALEAATKQVLENLAQQALAKSLFYTAQGIADSFWNPPAAAADFAAAAEFAVVAGAAGAVGIAMPGGGGSSAATQQGPTAGQSSTGSGGGGGAGSGPTQTVSTPKLAEGGVVSKPTTFVAGDSPSGGEADEAILPLSDPTAMRQVASAIAPGGLPQSTPAEQSLVDPEAIKRMTEAIATITGTREAQEFHFAEPGTGEAPGFQFDGSTSAPGKEFSSTAGTVGDVLGFGSATPSPIEKTSFTSADSIASDKQPFTSAESAASDKQTFVSPQSGSVSETPAIAAPAAGSVSETPAIVSAPSASSEKATFAPAGAPSRSEASDFASGGTATVGEALGFTSAEPSSSQDVKPDFTSAQPSASDKQGFTSAEPSAIVPSNDKTEFSSATRGASEAPGFESNSPTVGEALGFTQPEASVSGKLDFKLAEQSPAPTPQSVAAPSAQPSAVPIPPVGSPTPPGAATPPTPTAIPASASASEKPGFGFDAATASGSREFESSSPTVGEALGFTEDSSNEVAKQEVAPPAIPPSLSKDLSFTRETSQPVTNPVIDRVTSPVTPAAASPASPPASSPTVGEALGFTTAPISQRSDISQKSDNAAAPVQPGSPSEKQTFLPGGEASEGAKPDLAFAPASASNDTARNITPLPAAQPAPGAASAVSPPIPSTESANHDFRFGAPTPSPREAAGFTSGEPAPGERPAFASAEPSETAKTDFLSAQPSVSEKPGFDSGSPTVGEALGFKFDTPYPGDKPVFSSGEPSAPDKPGFSLAAPSANEQRDFAASAPTVGEALGFGFSSPAPSHEGLGFTSGQPSATSTPGFSSGAPSPHEKQSDAFGQPSAGQRPGFDYSAPSLPREMPDMESIASQFGGLLSQPTLRAASDSQVPAAAVSASQASAPIDIEAHMEKFAEKMGAQTNPENRDTGGDTTHVHVNVKGMISPDNLRKVIKKQNRMVANRQATVNASNSLRITRRSQ